jgi:hypothetical protein
LYIYADHIATLACTQQVYAQQTHDTTASDQLNADNALAMHNMAWVQASLLPKTMLHNM